GPVEPFAVVRAKGRRQVAADRSPPVADVRFLHRAALRSEPGLQKAYDRCVIEDLGVDRTTGTPWGYDDEPHTVPEPDRVVAIVDVGPLDGGVDARGCLPSPRAFGVRRDEWRHVVEVAVILVVTEDEHRLLPDLGTPGQNVERL